MNKKGYVYIMTNKRNTVLYMGVTGNLIKRVYEHKTGTVEGFTKRYRCHKPSFPRVCRSPIENNRSNFAAEAGDGIV